MQDRAHLIIAAAFVAIAPLLPLTAIAGEPRAPLQLAMMDMMMPPASGMAAAPTPGGGMPGMPAPGAAAAKPGMMDDDKMRSGAGAMPQAAQGAGQGCGMMEMMQKMMPAAGGTPSMPGMTSAAPAAAGATTPGDSAARLEDRIASLRASLRVTDRQAASWDVFASALRVGRGHLDAAREALQGAGAAADPMTRLQGYEDHLMARTEALRVTRLAFNAMFGQLDNAQKQTATATMLPFIGTF